MGDDTSGRTAAQERAWSAWLRDQERARYHEAAHAVAYRLLGKRIVSVAVEGDGSGLCRSVPGRLNLDYPRGGRRGWVSRTQLPRVERDIVGTLAGPLAECLLSGRDVINAYARREVRQRFRALRRGEVTAVFPWSDFSWTWRALEQTTHLDARPLRLRMEELELRAEALLREHWISVALVAELLEEGVELDGRDICRAMRWIRKQGARCLSAPDSARPVRWKRDEHCPSWWPSA